MEKLFILSRWSKKNQKQSNINPPHPLTFFFTAKILFFSYIHFFCVCTFFPFSCCNISPLVFLFLRCQNIWCPLAICKEMSENWCSTIHSFLWCDFYIELCDRTSNFSHFFLLWLFSTMMMMMTMVDIQDMKQSYKRLPLTYHTKISLNMMLVHWLPCSGNREPSDTCCHIQVMSNLVSFLDPVLLGYEIEQHNTKKWNYTSIDMFYGKK